MLGLTAISTKIKAAIIKKADRSITDKYNDWKKLTGMNDSKYKSAACSKRHIRNTSAW
jgi:hypothetical protein